MFENFSDEANIWIFGFKNKLDKSKSEIVDSFVENFVAHWHSHRTPVQGAYKIIENQFVVLVAEDSVSGCSIDNTFGVFKELKHNYDLDALNQGLIYFKRDKIIEVLERSDFQKLVDENKISADTTVYDLTITKLRQFRAGMWNRPFSKSWQWKAFKKSA